MPCSGQGVDQRVVGAVREVVEVLHTHHGRDGLGFLDLLGGDGTDTEMPDQPLLLELREHGERFGERTQYGGVEPSHPQVDDVECVQAEVLEVAVHGLAKLVARQRLRPPPRRPAVLRPWSRGAGRPDRGAALP